MDEKIFYLKVRELDRPDLAGTNYTQIAYRSWFGEAFATVERKFVKNNWVKITLSQEADWNDCALVTIYGLSKGSFRFLAWVNKEDISERMDDVGSMDGIEHGVGAVEP